MVFNTQHAQEFFDALRRSIEAVPEKERPMVRRFLSKMESAIETGKRLTSKQSDSDRGNY